ncbi:OmpP1/FadL family transporter [Roseibium algae]|uniref:OmpP1/FadL family transporter n=1 Tax=Roseibium algae TaxID=3123038 RepID=A0ABU8TKY9_9HYPH
MSWASTKSVNLTSTAIALGLMCGPAFAGGFALREQSAYYQGMSFAGNGTTGPSISSIFWNPATITGARDGFTFEAHNAFILPQAEIKGDHSVTVPGPSTITTPFNTGDIGSDAWVGATYASYKVSDQVFLGFGLNAPYGLSTKPKDPNWPGAGYNRSSKVFSINANPIVGFKLNEMVSIAVGAQIQYIHVRLTNSAAAPVLSSGTTSLDGTSTAVGFTAGVTITPFEGTEIGLGFRSSVGHDVSGTVFLPVAGSLPVGSYSIKTKLITPEMVTLSAKQRITDNFRILGTFEWTNWSRLTEPKVLLEANDAQLTTLPFNYEDGYFLSVGGEYDFNEKITLRAGAAYEWSPVTTQTRSARLPDNDRIWVSAGSSYRFNDALSFDLGYTHIFGTDTDLKIVPGHQDYASTKGSLTGEIDSSVDIFTASMRYTF